jgi:beta-lactam-binding protein with PASTA domain
MRLADAQIKLFKVNCALGKVTNVHSKVQKGRVVDQSPGPGGVFAADTKVRLMVSSGR